MLLSLGGRHPEIDPAAYVAPDATVAGDVRLGPGCRVMHGARVIAEGGTITLGRDCIVLENAVLRSTSRHDLRVGDHCLVGPGAHVVGCTLADEVFIATGAVVLHAAHLGPRSEVRVHGVVHVSTRLSADATVPIAHVAVGDPARVLPPGAHEEIWALQEPLDFPLVAYGLPRAGATMELITRQMSRALGAQQDGP